MTNTSKTIQINYKLHEDMFDLPNEWQSLIESAKTITHQAYAPYSHFKVGAAILLENGIVVTGNNQENMAFPSGLCAERVAVFYAGAQYPNQKIKAIAIAVHPENFEVSQPLAPCGSCRQSLLEYELKQNEDIDVLLTGQSGSVIQINGIKSLLPLHFIEERLKKS
jgi:cytidine deaminase